MATPSAQVATDFEALYQSAPCGYLVTDGRGAIVEVNDTFLGWTGHERSAVVGTELARLLPVGDRILWSTHALPQLEVTGAVAEMAVEVVAADRSRRSALLSASRAHLGDGVVEDRIVVFSAHERLAYERNLVEALRRAEDSEIRQAQVEADLRHLTHHDEVTGLPNRTLLLEVLARRRETGVAVLRVDLDRFTAVNDDLGLEAGDELLVRIAQRLREAVTPDSTVARLSADEFVVVAAVEDDDAALHLGHRLLVAVEAPVLLGDLEVVTTATIGIVPAPGGLDSERVLRHSDIAVRRGKARGGSCCELVRDPAPGSTVDLRLLSDLRRGIEGGQLRLHHQPRMDLATQAVSGVEALVRWQHPERGLLPPAAFVDAAAACGLILPLGAWVLDAAVAQAAEWRRRDPEGGGVEMAVNLSTRQLADPGLAAQVTEALDRHGLPPHLLTLEITETALMGDPDRAVATLRSLADLGISLAVDDFGTGYSSLTYLKRYPIHELKIDRSFVAGLGTDDGDTAIVTSCIELAHALGLRAVGEGVETEQQRAALAERGCDLGQGYLFSRPLPADALAEWSRARRRR